MLSIFENLNLSGKLTMHDFWKIFDNNRVTDEGTYYVNYINNEYKNKDNLPREFYVLLSLKNAYSKTFYITNKNQPSLKVLGINEILNCDHMFNFSFKKNKLIPILMCSNVFENNLLAIMCYNIDKKDYCFCYMNVNQNKLNVQNKIQDFPSCIETMIKFISKK